MKPINWICSFIVFKYLFYLWFDYSYYLSIAGIILLLFYLYLYYKIIFWLFFSLFNMESSILIYLFFYIAKMSLCYLKTKKLIYLSFIIYLIKRVFFIVILKLMINFEKKNIVIIRITSCWLIERWHKTLYTKITIIF